MSKRGNRRTCPSGKVRYRDHEQATAALQRLKVSSTRSKIQTRDYPCSQCQGYHLTASRRDVYSD